MWWRDSAEVERSLHSLVFGFLYRVSSSRQKELKKIQFGSRKYFRLFPLPGRQGLDACCSMSEWYGIFNPYEKRTYDRITSECTRLLIMQIVTKVGHGWMPVCLSWSTWKDDALVRLRLRFSLIIECLRRL